MRVFNSVQILRGMAMLAVLAFHAAQRSGHTLMIGGVGVDVFFVISGFIMWTVTRKPTSPGQFLTRRLIRVVPLYWAVTLALVALSAVPGTLPNLQPGWRHVLLSLLFIPHLAPDGTVFPVLVPGWTLTYEMGFYGLFAAFLVLPSAIRLLGLSTALAGLAAVGAMVQPTGPVLETCTDPLLLEFLAGVWLGALPRPSRRFGVLLVSAAAAAAVAQAGLSEMAGPRLLVWGLPAVALVAGSLGLDSGGRGMTWPGWMLSTLGDASYSVYLMHGMVVAACWRVLHAWPLPVFYAACLAGAVGVGMLVHVTIELPLIAWLRRQTEPGRRRNDTQAREALPPAVATTPP